MNVPAAGKLLPALVPLLDDTSELGPLADGALLERWYRRRDEAAFALLVARHGPMVLGVCRRVLRNDADAEDAFQATFLVLVRKGRTVRRRDSLGGWLHQVAYRVALRARKRRPETVCPDFDPAAPAGPARDPDLEALLDREVDRLPGRQRAAFVLCCLEGRTQAEAARLLGVPEGTLSARVTRARQRLRRRLTERGLAPAVPAALLRAALDVTGDTGVSPVVNGLAKEVLRTMFLHRLSKAAAGLVVALVLLGGGLVLCPAGGDSEPKAVAKPAGPAPPEGTKDEKPVVDEAWTAWLDRRAKMKMVSYEVTRRVKDKALKSEEVWQGRLLGRFDQLKEDLTAERQAEKRRQIFRVGERVVLLSHADKWVGESLGKGERSAPFAAILSDPTFAVLLPGDEENVKKRFAVKLTKSDQHYTYFEIRPHAPKDKELFRQARLVLVKETDLPRQFWFDTDGGETTFDLTNAGFVPAVPGDAFLPVIPTAWKYVKE